MRKALVSIGVGGQRTLLRIAATSFVPYARRHGYEPHLIRESLDTSRPAAWSKVAALTRLQTRYDLLLWLDADLVIADGRRDIATELDDGAFLYLVEHETKHGRMPNSGVMMLRTGDDCAVFLERVWEQDDLVHHVWWENAAICRLLGYGLDPPRPLSRTRWLERTRLLEGAWNSIPDAQTAGARIRHYPGYTVKTRAAFMARDAVLAAARRKLGRS